ncbi:MAG TPA: hypothetical protein VHG70_08475 [Nocardioidaceae bacterium]|nr:hypothetical protein [Nocardioidaceae bacterium]
MIGEAVKDLDVEQTLDAVELWHAERTDRDIRIFVAAAHFADLHHPDSRPDHGKALPGMEKPVRLGGAGTPRVFEFAAAEFGPRIGRSPYAGQALMADALDCRHRLPALWARVCAGEVPVSYARHVAQQTRDLSEKAAGFVDAKVATYADGRLSWGRFATLVAAKVVEADPEAAAERERTAAEEEFAKVGRSNEHGQKTLYVRSAAAAIIRIDATIAYLADALAALGNTDTLDRRRALAILILANPAQALQLLQAFAAHRAKATSANTSNSTPSDGEGADDAADTSGHSDEDAAGFGDEPGTFDDLYDLDDTADTDDTDDTADTDDADDTTDDKAGDQAGAGGAGPVAAFCKPFRPYQIGPDSRFGCGFDPKKLLPRVTVYLHLYARTDTGEVGPVARWEGEGPISSQYVRDLLGPSAHFTIKPVLDLAGMAPVDGYEIPDRHREAVHLRTPVDVFPYAANTSRRQQLDHTDPYIPPDHGGPPGQTGLHNLGPMTQLHHRVKTHGAHQVKQPYPGIFVWRDPHGRCYLVDHTGTRKLGNTEPATATADLATNVYEDDPGLDIYYDRRHAA